MQQYALHMQSCYAASQVLVYNNAHLNIRCPASENVCSLPALGSNVVDK